MKKLISMMLALILCLSLCACGGKPEETTAPEEPLSAEEIMAQEIFSDPYLDGVEHQGLLIDADTASETQVAYAMAALNMKAHYSIEGYEYLHKSWIYAKMTFSDGTYYVPITTALPTAGSMDALYVNQYNAIKANHGRIVVATQLPVFQLSEEKLTEMKAMDGWADLPDSSIHLLYLMSECLADLGLNIESEGVEYVYSDVSAFAQCSHDTEEGPVVTLFDLQIMDRDASGAYLCSITVITGITLGETEDGLKAILDETDQAVLDEVMTYYDLYSWYD